MGAILVDFITARPLARAETRSLAYVAALGAAAVYVLIFPLWRSQFLVEIWPTESWNAYWQDAASQGLPLYPDPTSLVGNNYPPLSFYAVSLLGKPTCRPAEAITRMSLRGILVSYYETVGPFMEDARARSPRVYENYLYYVERFRD